MSDVTIVSLPTLIVTAVAHRGPYLDIGRAFETLFGTLGARGLMPAAHGRMIGVFYDDARTTAAADLRSAAAVVTTEPIAAAEAPLERIELAAGRYAVLRHVGPHAELQGTYDWLFGTWLPRSGETLRDAPSWEEYLNTPMDTLAHELLTDIHVPLR